MTFSPEELERRRQRIYIIKPWERSTGAKTERGKAIIISQNALKTGLYSSFEPIRVLARWEREAEAIERIYQIMLKMEDAYENSDTPPPQRWEQVFKNMSREDFLRAWRKLEQARRSVNTDVED